MSATDDPKLHGRRRFLASATTLAAAASVAPALSYGRSQAASGANAGDIVPFFGEHQAGITTPQQAHVYFAAFDVATEKRDELIALLKAWTNAAARMAQGQTGVPLTNDPGKEPLDSGEAQDLSARRLTLTFGFGPSLFEKDGKDRFGLGNHRPAALADLPRFNGDQLVAERTGGDLCIQACADDPQVVLHAARQLARLSYGVAHLRWAQPGFLSRGHSAHETPRNLMGFKDGTMNPDSSSSKAMNDFVWAGNETVWMQGGSYLVARPIRIALEHWDRMKLAFQEQVVGRHKDTGAPFGKKSEFDALDLDANDADGNPVLPENSHVRLGAPAVNEGAQILRRSYSYDNGLSFTAERWPPWHQGMEFDAGLMFVCFQHDPRQGFIKIFDKMSKFDMMNQFVTHIGGGVFACPPGVREGGYIGQTLFEVA
ncbi:iron uptake transporter deferrochelatase/peroxidase subunit [Dyella sp. 20L07]|uniref:iron uptake transporter deferrochelatase/peroxidase subunit n=1 Tax=Dyella sp. 20L07 TaxID=3384240 RepID=UPI003D2E8E17